MILAPRGPTPTGTRTGMERMQMQTFARKLREIMQSKGLSQSDLARAVFGTMTDTRGYEVAAGRDRISSYLAGKSLPNSVNIQRLADALSTKVEDLAPELAASAIDKSHPEVSITQVTGRQDQTLLQINKLLPFHLAVKIVALISEYDESKKPKFTNG